MNVLVNVVDDELRILVESNKKSIFGKLLNFEYYNLNFHYCGNYTDKKINKKCG